MRPDQIAQLDDIVERLADAFIMEADPMNWPGAGKLPVDMDRDTRGDRHWSQKAAMGTGGVLKYVIDLKERSINGHTADPEMNHERESELDGQIRRAQKTAADALARIQGKTPAKAKPAHGR